MSETQFIAHDWCGWNEQYGRYTHVPGGETLVCKPDWGQTEWDKAQLTYLSQYPGVKVYHCPGAYTTQGTTCWGTTDEICEKLNRRLFDEESKKILSY